MSALILQADLPLPPSANDMYRFMRGGVYPTKKYLDWLLAASEIILEQRTEPIEGRIAVAITVWGGKGWTESSDLDNCRKAVNDVLQPKMRKVGGTRERPVMRQFGSGLIQSDDCRTVRASSERYFDRQERARIEGRKIKDLEPAYLELKIYRHGGSACA